MKSLYLPVGYDICKLCASCQELFPHLGTVAARAWPDMQECMKQIVPEQFGDEDCSFQRVHTLPDSVLKKYYSPDHSDIYLLETPNAFAKFLLASMCHSELRTDFFPGNLSLGHIGRLCLASDQYAFTQDESLFSGLPWFMGVSIDMVENDRLLVVTASDGLMESLLDAMLHHPRGAGVFEL